MCESCFTTYLHFHGNWRTSFNLCWIFWWNFLHNFQLVRSGAVVWRYHGTFQKRPICCLWKIKHSKHIHWFQNLLYQFRCNQLNLQIFFFCSFLHSLKSCFNSSMYISSSSHSSRAPFINQFFRNDNVKNQRKRFTVSNLQNTVLNFSINLNLQLFLHDYDYYFLTRKLWYTIRLYY